MDTNNLISRDWTDLSDLVLDLIFQKLPSINKRYTIMDVIYYNKRYYVVTYGGGVLSMNRNRLEYMEIAPFINKDGLDLTRNYLVKNIANELLRNEISHPLYNKSSCNISISRVLKMTSQNLMFEELNELGNDESLFLCDYCLISISTSKF